MNDPLLHPFAHPAKAEAAYIRLVRAEGSTVWDDRGRPYVDAIANLWNCHVGHGRAEIVEAVAAQLATLDCYNTFEPFSNDVAVSTADVIRSRSPHPDGRVFLGTSGSDAVDSALKLVRLVAGIRSGPERQIMVTRTGGYHGTNAGGTSLQGLPLNREGWGDLVPHVIEVDGDDLEAMATVFAEHGDRIAGVIAEPVQGASGVHPPPDGYLAGLRRLCDDHDALLVFDEVICGFGRTGAWFGADTYGVTPDLLIFAKGVTSGYQPLSGVIVSSDVAATLAEQPDRYLRTGYTYSGHPACCAAAQANIGIIEDEGLVARAGELHRRFDEALGALVTDGLAVSHRGVGALWAIDLGRDTVAARDRLLERGVIVRPIGTALAMCPPLSIPFDDLGVVFDGLAEVLADGEGPQPAA